MQMNIKFVNQDDTGRFAKHSRQGFIFRSQLIRRQQKVVLRHGLNGKVRD